MEIGEIFGNTRILDELESWGVERRFLVECQSCSGTFKVLITSLMKREHEDRKSCPHCREHFKNKVKPPYGLPELGRLFMAGKL
jgi:hypothetical protein